VPRAYKIVILIVVVVAVLAAVAVIFQRPILTAVATRAVKDAFSKQSIEFEDGLYAGLCGSGGPFPDINRVESCVAVLAGDHLYIVDAGAGSARNAALMGLQMGKIEAIFLTHFHSDHIADLGEFMLQRWATGSTKGPVDVIGPDGVENVVEGFNRAYELDAGYRIAHHGPETVPPSGAGGSARVFALSAGPDASAVIVEKDGVKVTAFKVDHAPVSPAVGYRFDYKGRSLVISGDTSPGDSLLRHAAGADVLLHDALQPALVKIIHDLAGYSSTPSLARITADVPGYHASPEDAARIASAAGVKQLVLYHIVPPLPPVLNGMFLGDSSKFYSGPIIIGEDGMLVSLPANSDKIYFRNILK